MAFEDLAALILLGNRIAVCLEVAASSPYQNGTPGHCPLPFPTTPRLPSLGKQQGSTKWHCNQPIYSITLAKKVDLGSGTL